MLHASLNLSMLRQHGEFPYLLDFPQFQIFLVDLIKTAHQGAHAVQGSSSLVERREVFHPRSNIE